MEASAPRSKGHKALLVYTPSKPLKNVCFSMWYHMYGSDVGSLAVEIPDSQGKSVEVWKKQDGQGDKWQKMSFTVSNPATKVSLALYHS